MPSYEEVRYHFNHHDPFARHMGIELLEVGPEHGVAIMPLDERHRNGMGHAHGGAIFALVDMTFATVSNADLLERMRYLSAHSDTGIYESGSTPLKNSSSI